MASNTTLIRAVKIALIAAGSYGVAAVAQDTEIEQVVVTGTRITLPGIESASPITSVGAAEIALQQQPSVERIVRILPSAVAGDGQNVNNGSDAAQTINLRGLGSQRNLILLDGHRLTPYNIFGVVDVSIIPSALIERLDVVTGGASAVYGSDAIAGALNFIMKDDFEGVELGYTFGTTGRGDGDTDTFNLTLGTNSADGRGNAVLGLTWSEREAVTQGERNYGRQIINSFTGFGLSNLNQGIPPAGPLPGCEGGVNPVSNAAGGSGTTIPTRAIDIAGARSLGQFRNDGTLLAARCSSYNFNPYNYYQTPQEQWGGYAAADYEVNEHADVYAKALFMSTNVDLTVAPGGIFTQPYWTPLANPFIGTQARTRMIDRGNESRVAGQLIIDGTQGIGEVANWRDVNNNGIVDVADQLNITYSRRTEELGPRSSDYSANLFQLIGGVKGDITDKWSYDASYSYGRSNRTQVDSGYTNNFTVQNALQTLDGKTCLTDTANCVPLNIFGGYGSITPEMGKYIGATALERQLYDQLVINGVVTGELYQFSWVDTPVAVSIGADYRSEYGETNPDLCLQALPVGCLGGSGGNTLPTQGRYNVQEYYGEAIVPLVSDVPFMQSFQLELGYRWSDYSVTGSDPTWKYGFSWRPFDQLLVRVMEQRAARAPNIYELYGPQSTSLNNAAGDPCSDWADAPALTPELRALCEYTGQTAAQVQNVPDIIVNQINSFSGTVPTNVPKPEQADTFTAGLVWTPDFGGETFNNWIFSVDYYDIDIQDFIGTFSPDEVLDACYQQGDLNQCDSIIRVGGNLILPGSGVGTYTQNLEYFKTSGIEAAFAFGVALGEYGDLNFSGNANWYLKWDQRSAKTIPVLDCLGVYSNSCDGLPETKFIQRTTWNLGIFEASYLWRYIGSMEAADDIRGDLYEKFRSVDAMNYIDLYFGVNVLENTKLSLGIQNVFNETPPIVGNSVGTTAYNGGNTFPSLYDTLGTIYTLGVNVKF